MAPSAATSNASTMTTDWTDRSTLLAADLSPREISAMVSTGQLRRFRRGRYAVAGAWDVANDQQRHRTRARELGSAVAGRAAISHESAALLHGLLLPAGGLSRVHLTWPGSPGRRATPHVTPHRGRLAASDLIEIDGVLLTSVARTVFDVARLGVWHRAIAVADSALRLLLCSREDFVDVIDRHHRVPGAFRARRILEFADPLAESVGESICRLSMAQIGLPAPTLQSVVSSLDNIHDYRVDFEFETMRTVAEFDGRVKYGRLLKSGQSAGDAAFAEKVREDRIRDTGRQVVRVVWADLGAGPSLLSRFVAAFRRAGFDDWQPGPPRFVAAAYPRTQVPSSKRLV